LLAWSVAFMTVPGVSALVSLLLLTLAGLAWPWAWLALPALLAYFFRHGWQALGATVGLLGGAAAVLVGTTALVAPTLPRQDGAFADAGITPTYAARLSNDRTVIIERYRPNETTEPTFKSWMWKPLLNREDARLGSTRARLALPNGVDAGSIMYRDILASGAVRGTLQEDYRAALAQEPRVARTWASLRTLLEATWKPAVDRARPMTGVWDLWAAAQPGAAGRWAAIRRTGKIAVGLVSLLVAFLLIRGERKQLHQLVGGLLVVSAATLLISELGAATNWIWLMPTALAALAAKGGPAAVATPPPPASGLAPFEHGAAPRITVEN
ncbi:MAG: hypothetical protein ACE5I3_15465, partial [Phycisphaerae bacterium]